MCVKNVNSPCLKQFSVSLIGKSSKTTTIKQSITEDKAKSSKGEDFELKFNGKGHLIFRNNTFIRSFARGLTFATVYKCFNAKSDKCQMILKFKGKSLENIVGEHNHEDNCKIK